jgi:hypothetical protein
MALQADKSTGKATRILTTANAAEPDETTPPTITLGPQASSGLSTTGTVFSLQRPATVTNAEAQPTGFSVVMWFRNPVTMSWASGAASLVFYRQFFGSFEFDATDIYFQIEASSVLSDGSIIIETMEQ